MRQYIYSEILAAIRPESFLFAMYTMQKFYHSYIPVFFTYFILFEGDKPPYFPGSIFPPETAL